MTSRPSHETDATATLLRDVLADRAAVVRPDPGGIGEIRRRIRYASAAHTRRRLAGGVLALTAAAVTSLVVVIVAHAPSRQPAADHPSTPTAHAEAIGTPASVYRPSAPERRQLVISYLGPDPRSRLYTEIHTVLPYGPNPTLTLLNEFLTATPLDPDYSSGWRATGVRAVAVTSSSRVTTVALVGPPGYAPFPLTADASVSEQRRAMAIQALLATARLDGQVRFSYNDQPVADLSGRSDTVDALPAEKTRPFVSIDDLDNGQVLTNPVTIQVSGNVDEGNVNWSLLDGSGQQVNDGYVTVGSFGTWAQAPINLGKLPEGTYTIRCWDVNPGNGKQVDVDDKAFRVR